MLDLIRRKQKTGLVKLVFWAIIAAFVGTIFLVWGKGSDQGVTSNSVAATVGDTEISFAEYQSVYSNLYNLYQSIYRDQFTPEMEKRLNLRQQALDSLIDQALLAQEAGRLGIKVSKKELVDSIAQTPAFQSNGVFDKNLYVQVLNYQRITPEQFEASQQRTLLISKIQEEIQGKISVSDEDIEQDYRQQNESINLDYLRFSPVISAARVKIEEEGLVDFFKENIETFRIDEKIALRYLQFDPERYQEEIEFQQSDLERFYRRNLINFEVSEQLGASHILIQVPEQATAEEKTLKREHAEKVLAEVREGKDFAELARTYSDDPGSAAEGGRLPDFTRGTMVAAFEDAAFTLSPGDISELVETPFGFHIIRVESYIEAGVKPLAEVMDQVKEGLRLEKARQLAMEKAMDAFNINRKEGNLQAAATANDLGIKETGFFSRSGAIDGLPDLPVIKDAAFALSTDRLARPIQTDSGVVLMALRERKESRLPELEEVRPRVVEAYRDSRADELALAGAEEALAKLKESSAPLSPKLASSFSLQIEETGFFTRSYGDFVPRIGASQELFDRAFQLDAPGATPQEIFPVGQDYILVSLKEREEAKMEELSDSRREEIRSRLVSSQEEEAVKTTLESLRENTEINILPVMANTLF